jgi:hypothetical protein
LGGYVQNVTVVGVDPVVVFDATWAYNVTNSDVLLFYLSADRSRFLSRVQRDIYGTEYELHDYGQPVILDRVSRLPLQYQALVSDVVGNPLMVDGERVGLLSNLYPYLANDALSASLASALPGFYEPMVLRFTPNEYLVTEGSALSGTYEPAVEYAYIEEPNPLLAGFLSALDGAYEVVVSRTSASEEPFTASFVQSIPGAYVFAVFRYTGDENAANITASALDGSYML